MLFQASLGPLGAVGGVFGLLGLLRASFGASWGPLGGSWVRLGSLLGVLDAKLELDIVLYGFHFPGGPSWRHLGVDLGFFLKPFWTEAF